MDPKDRDQNHNDREVERWMNAALSQHSNVEPRTGLENRILANLQSERTRLALQSRWWWTAGTVVLAAAIVVAMWLGEGSVRRSPPRTVESPAMTHQEDAGVSKPPARPRQGDRRAIAAPPKRLEERASRHSSPGKAPKLDQFPSPAPLNEQEQMLARYVEDFPQRAALIARSQTDLRKQDELEMSAPRPKNARSSSDQPE